MYYALAQPLTFGWHEALVRWKLLSRADTRDLRQKGIDLSVELIQIIIQIIMDLLQSVLFDPATARLAVWAVWAVFELERCATPSAVY